MRTTIIKKGMPVGAISVCLILAVGLPLGSRAQASISAPACALLGATSVPGGTVATYNLKGCQADSWQLSCGVVNAQTDSSVTIFLNAAACNSVVLTARKGNSTIASKTIAIKVAPALSGGMITGASQTVTKDSLPVQITASAASQGVCNGVYTYQWYRSTDSVHFDAIPGAIGRYYQPGPLDSTTWFKRQTNCSGSTIFTGNTVAVHIQPPIAIGAMQPDVQMLNGQGQPVAIVLSGVSGGSGGFTYQWQSNRASRKTAWQTIPGATSPTYLPGLPDSATYYRVLIHSRGDSVYSPEAVVGVYPPLVAGSVSPATQTVSYDSIPIELSVSGFSGGNGAYTYQWYSSPDGASWSPLDGVVTAEYGPAGNLPTTYYRVAVTSNGVTTMSASAVVTIPAATSTANQ